jgi:hypothetical protein
MERIQFIYDFLKGKNKFGHILSLQQSLEFFSVLIRDTRGNGWVLPRLRNSNPGWVCGWGPTIGRNLNGIGNVKQVVGRSELIVEFHDRTNNIDHFQTSGQFFGDSLKGYLVEGLSVSLVPEPMFDSCTPPSAACEVA